MKLLSNFGKTALVAVFLFVLACGGDDSFEPAPGASIAEDEIEGLIDAAIADFDLDRAAVQPQEFVDDSGLRSCFEVESGPCSRPRAPSTTVWLEGEGGAQVFISVALGIDALEAGDLVRSAAQGRAFTATETLRVIYESAPVPATLVSGPCRQSADWASDEGCAWQERGAPNVGDDARAMKSDSLEVTRLSAVAFAREFLFADVQVITSDGNVPNALADDIAEALDEQIKLALSQ